ncbi:general stress protein [Agrococcus sp. Marseille-P2731]|uniref:general stress protein n=1 Tax=Agrococcus sp. Marseille-P2731 TaxID=1841862 RepID=UPI000930AB57|nr:general stress protein [Agrococcus sp. Marseille-P2731]
MFQRSALGDQQLPKGVVVASFETYDQAQAAVAKVSSSDTELAGLAIIGNDLKLVERIVGRLTWGKVAMRGALRGLGFGAFLGLMFLVFVPEAIGSVLVFPLLGLAFGILLGVVQHSIVRRKRDFASTQQVLATRYDVVAPQEISGRAMQIIGQREAAQQPTAAQLHTAPPPHGDPLAPPQGTDAPQQPEAHQPGAPASGDRA